MNENESLCCISDRLLQPSPIGAFCQQNTLYSNYAGDHGPAAAVSSKQLNLCSNKLGTRACAGDATYEVEQGRVRRWGQDGWQVRPRKGERLATAAPIKSYTPSPICLHGPKTAAGVYSGAREQMFLYWEDLNMPKFPHGDRVDAPLVSLHHHAGSYIGLGCPTLRRRKIK